MTGQLFDRPMSDLRETFVRGRFAEHQHFGTGSIEEWLEIQRRSSRAGFNFWVDPDFAKMHAELLAKTDELDALSCATPTNANKIDPPPFVSIKESEVRFYRSAGNRVLVYGRTLYEVEYGNGLSLVPKARGTINFRIYSILLREWQEHRPKWREARNLLCNLMAQKVAKARQEAEEDFDKAVAVSADGKKILHADAVVILSTGAFSPSKAVLYPGELFRGDRRIRLINPKKMKVTDIRVATEESLEEMARIQLGKWLSWGVIPGARWKGLTSDIPIQPWLQGKAGRILFTREYLAPDLPEIPVAIKLIG